MSEWIRVKEKPPEMHVEVLTYDQDQFKHINLDSLDQVFDDDYYFAQAGSSITHWMPLPAPPKDEP